MKSNRPFTVKIETTGWGRWCEIKPNGYWTDAVRVQQSTNIRTDIWEKPIITYSGGGTDGMLSNVDTIKAFISALKYALSVAKRWDTLTGKTKGVSPSRRGAP